MNTGDIRLLGFLLLTAALPIAWLIADLKARPAVRRCIGIAALLWSFAVASFVGMLRDITANLYFSGASKDLLEASVEQLNAGNVDSVRRAWSEADFSFHQSYENRKSYRQAVDTAIEQMKKK